MIVQKTCVNLDCDRYGDIFGCDAYYCPSCLKELADCTEEGDILESE